MHFPVSARVRCFLFPTRGSQITVKKTGFEYSVFVLFVTRVGSQNCGL